MLTLSVVSINDVRYCCWSLHFFWSVLLSWSLFQNPEDRTAFFMLQRFPSPEAMSRYQNTESFRAFTDVSTSGYIDTTLDRSLYSFDYLVNFAAPDTNSRDRFSNVTNGDMMRSKEYGNR